MRKYKIQKIIFATFVVLSLMSAMVLSSSAGQAVSDESAVIWLYPDGINVPIKDYGVDVDVSEYVEIDPYEYMGNIRGQTLITFNRAQYMMYTESYSGNGQVVRTVVNIIGYDEENDETSQTFAYLCVDYVEYDWTVAPEHFNVHFAIYDSDNHVLWEDGRGEGNYFDVYPIQLWIHATNQITYLKESPLLSYLPMQGLLFTEASYGRGYESGKRYQFANQHAVYEAGRTSGYTEGYADGIIQGGINAEELTFKGLIETVVLTPFNVVKDMFDFDLLGTNMSTLLFGIIGSMALIGVLIIIVKALR